MDSSTWSAIISGIALVAAVLSPIFTTKNNNHYQTKNNRIKYFDEHRAEVIENYIRYTGSVTKFSSLTDDFRSYGKYSKEIYLYLHEDLWHYIDEIDTFIINHKYDDATYSLAEFCKELNEYHPRFVKNKSNKNNK